MNGRAFIKGMGIISPQHTGEGFLQTPVDYRNNYLTCIEPDYTRWIGPQPLRRMSRILKMGAAAALMALKDAALDKPDAIITGTGYGCLEDTATFLTKITALNEEALNPTPFMQSTHNTIGSQIALLLQCQGYNQTFVHSAFSFEHALLDTLMLLAENAEQHVLAGGVDELTTVSHAVHSRFGKYRAPGPGTLSLWQNPQKGTVAGEGAAYFVMTAKPDAGAKASVNAVKTFYQPARDSADMIASFLADNGLEPEDIDLLLTGKSGDPATDRPADTAVSALFKNSSVGVFKHLCGEYCVSSSFALWLGATILAHDRVPDVVLIKNARRRVRSLLIYNTYFQDHHTLILLTSCRDTK